MLSVRGQTLKRAHSVSSFLGRAQEAKMNLEDKRMITLGGEQRWEEVLREASGQSYFLVS